MQPVTQIHVQLIDEILEFDPLTGQWKLLGQDNEVQAVPEINFFNVTNPDFIIFYVNCKFDVCVDNFISNLPHWL